MPSAAISCSARRPTASESASASEMESRKRENVESVGGQAIPETETETTAGGAGRRRPMPETATATEAAWTPGTRGQGCGQGNTSPTAGTRVSAKSAAVAEEEPSGGGPRK